MLYRKGYGAYPEYDDGGGEAPTVPADPVAENWELVASVPAAQTSVSDLAGVRDYWYFCAVATDLYGNQSASVMAGGVLNYLLGDVSDGGDPIQDGDNQVGVPDVTLLASVYGTSDGDPLYLNTVDVGPTEDLNVFSLPTTDDRIEFEDLMIFSINFGRDATAVPPVPFMAAAPPPADRNAVELDIPDLPATGQTFTVGLDMVANGQVQGLKIPLTWDENVLDFVGFQGGPLLADQGGQSLVLSPETGVVDIALIGVRPRGISGVGTLARVTFRVIGPGATGLGMGEISARDKANRSVPVGGESVDDPGASELPRVSALHPNYPNPFNPMTTISFDLASPGRVRISIFSIDGRLVRTLVDETFIPGHFERVWQGRDNQGRQVASGTYLYRMTGPGFQQTRRMLLIK